MMQSGKLPNNSVVQIKNLVSEQFWIFIIVRRLLCKTGSQRVRYSLTDCLITAYPCIVFS